MCYFEGPPPGPPPPTPSDFVWFWPWFLLRYLVRFWTFALSRKITLYLRRLIDVKQRLILEWKMSQKTHICYSSENKWVKWERMSLNVGPYWLYLLGDKSKIALTILIFLFLLNSLNWSPPWFRIVSPLLFTNKFLVILWYKLLIEVETVETLAFFALIVVATDGVNCLSLLFHSFPSCLSELFVALSFFYNVKVRQVYEQITPRFCKDV